MNKGQSLFELVIAIGISALIIVILVSLVSNALQNATFAKNETLSVRLAQEATEWLRGQRDSDPNTFFTNIASYPPDVARCFNVLSWDSVGSCGDDDKISGLFVRQVSFKSVGVTKNIIEVDTVVSWTDSKGLHQVTNATNFSDWRQR